MADQLTLTADTGRPTGSRASRRLRAEGKIPAVVYGSETEPTAISVDWPELRAALTTEAGLNALITLDVDGDQKLTIVKDMQRHTVRRDVTHVDFIVIDRDHALDVEVPITITNFDRPHLAELVVDQTMFSLPVSAKPGSIPNEFIVDCGELDVDAPIRAGHIEMPPGVELNVDPEDAVVLASLPIVEDLEPAEGEEVEGEAAAEAEGDDAEAAADGEAEGDADGGADE